MARFVTFIVVGLLLGCGSRTGLNTDPDGGLDSGRDTGPDGDRQDGDVVFPDGDVVFPDGDLPDGNVFPPDAELPDADLPDAMVLRDYCPLNDPFQIDPDPVDICPERCFIQNTRTRNPCDGEPRVSGTLLSDTAWSGKVCVGGEVGIRTGVTLRIQPGAEVYFERGAGIRIEGSLVAVGTASDPILFTSTSLEPKRADWQGIAVYLSEGGRANISQATIEYANIGLATWESSPPSMAGPETTVLARQVLFQFNNTAVTPDDNSDVTQSTVVCNNQGIFIAGEDTPVQQISLNNICDNLEWGMAAIQDDADARNNYWCTTDLMEIMDTVRDEADDISLGGLINVEPFRRMPIQQAPPIPDPR